MTRILWQFKAYSQTARCSGSAAAKQAQGWGCIYLILTPAKDHVIFFCFHMFNGIKQDLKKCMSPTVGFCKLMAIKMWDIVFINETEE